MIKRLALTTLLCVSSLAHAQDKIRLALNWKPEPEFAGFYTATLNGHYKAQNLDVEVLPGGSGTPTAQMVDNGKVEFGIVSADELVTLRSKGGDVVALFTVFQTNPQALMTHADRNITSLKELLTTSSAVFWQPALPYALHLKRIYKLKDQDIKSFPYNGGLPYLNDKSAAQQCFAFSEPLTAKAQGHNVSTFLIADSGYNPYTAVVICQGKLARENPQLLSRLTTALRAGWSDYLKDPEPTNAHLKKLNPILDLATMTEYATTQKPLIETDETKTNGLGTMTKDRWATLIQQLLTYRAITKEIKPDDCFVNPPVAKP